MIEPINGYLESYPHVFKVLQSFVQLESEGKLLPFQKYIVHCSKIVHPPTYLKPTTKYYLKHNIKSQNQTLLHAVQSKNVDSERSLPSEKVDNGEHDQPEGTTVLDKEWPLPEELDIDENQCLLNCTIKRVKLDSGPTRMWKDVYWFENS
ncbi:hypothetical protein DPMN_155245 [Dreissena polymorpha]|uniref:Uncharacterized protein n=1 Tax=Dreissena polymorpha TaxID=45954 RepID=A0A9D4J7P8_DREPO|nr:hypothetical protein DPMN_155245 [Dreissena polymorpha]